MCIPPPPLILRIRRYLFLICTLFWMRLNLPKEENSERQYHAHFVLVCGSLITCVCAWYNQTSYLNNTYIYLYMWSGDFSRGFKMEAIIRYRLLNNIWGLLAFIDVYKNTCSQQLPKTALAFASGQASHQPGRSICDYPERPRDGRTAEGDHSSISRRSGFKIRSHNQLDALSAATAMALTALFLVLLLIPSDAISCWKTTCSHFDRKVPRLPPPALHQYRSSYLAYFLSCASWHRVSHGTVSSITISFFVFYDISRTSGLCATLKEINSKSY